MLAKYKSGQDEIRKLVERAKAEKTDWEEVIRIFNTRFSHLPFQLQIKNREDVILKGSIESIEFIFRDSPAETASLDRVDSSKGYIKNNIRWVHRLVNQIKWDLKERQF